jgi:two-component system NtrC family sensor kinase
MIGELTMIADETARCGNIVKNLLLFSREKVGDFKEIDLRGVVDQSLKLIDHHMMMHAIRVETSFGDQPVTVYCDGHQIEEALLALEINAVEAMPDGGIFRIAVSADDTHDTVQITVSDTGVGIPADVLPHIFEPFYTTKMDGKGTGLGLSVVYGIIERHGGRVMVQSIPGAGATFTLSLPRRGQPSS